MIIDYEDDGVIRWERNGEKKHAELIELIEAYEDKRKHGTWGENIYGYRKCSVCGRVTQVDECMREPLYLYCPYCGARMGEVEND